MAKLIKYDITEDEEVNELLIEDQEISIKCKSKFLRTIISASKLIILGSIVDNRDNVIYTNKIHELYESVIDDIIDMKNDDNCMKFFDPDEEESLDNIIDRMGALDYEYANDIGVATVNLFVDIMIYNM